MKGAEAYVNDQWNTCGLTRLPRDSCALMVQLHFVIPRDAQFTSLLNEISNVCCRHLGQAYPGRSVHADPVVGSVVGDGSGDGICLRFHIGPQA
ncbi:MAG TPA: hypothetical protein VKY70_04610 [Pseudomonas sp.]|nr:hypothetical protein [Pseudomonas sp.]